jgi:hypothetical protein
MALRRDLCELVHALRRSIKGDSFLMPSKTKKQARTMAAAANDPAFAKKVGIPQKVAQEFHAADKKKAKT